MHAFLQMVTDSFHAEAKAALRALEFAVELGFRDVIVKGVIGNFQTISFLRVSKAANNAALALARNGLKSDGDEIWLEDWPSFLHPIIVQEASY
ncbi:hypothetical protein PTKIN_Ptkin11bG0135100 [Pterospermum kingtungense]